MEELIRFLNINATARQDANTIWTLIEPCLDAAIGSFYADIEQFDLGAQFNEETIERIGLELRKHWRKLFEGRFDQDYADSASLMGIKHRELGMDSRWHVAGYAKIKNDLAQLIFAAALPLPTKVALVLTLDKYIALDTALAVSSYTSVLID